VFWVISVYFDIRNTLPKSGTFLLGHPVYVYDISSLRVKVFLTTPGYVCFYNLFRVDKLSGTAADFLRVFTDTMGEKNDSNKRYLHVPSYGMEFFSRQ